MTDGTEDYLKRMLDPIVIITALSALVAIVGSYFTLSNRLEDHIRKDAELEKRLEKLNAVDDIAAADLKGFKDLYVTKHADLQKELEGSIENNRARIDSISARIGLIEQSVTAMLKTEADRGMQNDSLWSKQVDTNALINAEEDATKQNLAVLRAELDGILLAHERGEAYNPKPSPPR
jgi:hypothetical protein